MARLPLSHPSIKRFGIADWEFLKLHYLGHLVIETPPRGDRTVEEVDVAAFVASGGLAAFREDNVHKRLVDRQRVVPLTNPSLLDNSTIIDVEYEEVNPQPVLYRRVETYTRSDQIEAIATKIKTHFYGDADDPAYFPKKGEYHFVDELSKRPQPLHPDLWNQGREIFRFDGKRSRRITQEYHLDETISFVTALPNAINRWARFDILVRILVATVVYGIVCGILAAVGIGALVYFVVQGLIFISWPLLLALVGGLAAAAVVAKK